MGRIGLPMDDGDMKILLLPFLLIAPACSIDVDLGSDTIVGSGVERTDTFTFDADIDRIDVGSLVEVVVEIDPDAASTSVELTGDDNVLDELEVEQDGESLRIGARNGVNFELETRPVAVVTITDLSEIDASGVTEVRVDDLRDTDELSIGTSGAARVEVDGDVETLEVDASGASVVRHMGSATTATLDASGGSIVEVEGPVTATTVDGSGGSTFRIDTVEVTGELSGGSRLRLTGDTREIRVETSGASLID